jgi:hypothetical protein
MRTIAGALDGVARASELDDGRALFEALDWRSRAALHSISRDRRAAARLISADYPAAERRVRLRDLGDAARKADAADLFSARCPRECRVQLTANVGAPTKVTWDGDEVEVHTSRNGRFRLHRGPDGRWGLVWNTAALTDERLRATREVRQIRRNAAIYRKRRALAAELEPTVAAF